MNKKKINQIITSKIDDWLDVISKTDKSLAKDLKDNIILSGGAIASLFLGERVNDYDIYLKDMDVLLRLLKFYEIEKYGPEDKNFLFIMDGRQKNEYETEFEHSLLENSNFINSSIKSLNEDQIKLAIYEGGIKIPLNENELEGEEASKYRLKFLSANAITLTDDIQVILRFTGSAQKIHKYFDFVHATNYWTYKNGLTLNKAALESLLSKELRYRGSKYPLTSIIRIRKFINRGWSINAGEMLKIMFQISQLNLTDVDILEEQLIGVDVYFFKELIAELKKSDGNIDGTELSRLIDQIFNDE